MSAEEEKRVKEKILFDYAETKKALGVLTEEAHQLGDEFQALGEMLKSNRVGKIAVECYEKYLSKAYYDVLVHLKADIPRAEVEVARLTTKMREVCSAPL